MSNCGHLRVYHSVGMLVPKYAERSEPCLFCRISALEADVADVAKINVDLMKRNRALEAALRGIATNTLKQGSTDERRNEGIRIGLAMAADMATRALDSELETKGEQG